MGDQLRSYLGRQFRVEVSDGRVITGLFSCIDNDKNIVLKECIELQSFKIPNCDKIVEEHRVLGTVLIPGKHIVSCGIRKTE